MKCSDEAAERGFINNLPEKLEYLEHRTSFYIGNKAARHREHETKGPRAEAGPGGAGPAPELPQESAEEGNQD